MPSYLKGLDANQVLRSVYDDTKNTLRVSIVDGTNGGGEFEVIINHVDDSVRLGNGTDFFTSTYIGPKVGLDVGVINEVNIENLDSSKDNVAIRDSDGNELEINDDGSINAKILTEGTTRNFFNEVTSVPSNIQTTIQTITILQKSRLQRINVSGTNIATYEVYINGTLFDRQRSYFTQLNLFFEFGEQPLNVSDVIVVKVFHTRPTVGDFNSKIQIIEE